MRVLLSAFQCWPGAGSELGHAWDWATALNDMGHDVTILTPSIFREPILATNPHGVKFHFVDLPVLSAPRFFSRLNIYNSYNTYVRWQDAALRHVADQAHQYDVTHHVAWGSLHLGSMLWQLPVPLLYGPIGGGQTAPAKYWRYFGRTWPAETLRTAATGPLLKLNRRSRETIRNSAVTLVTNSATAIACRRLGGGDVRYMLSEGLTKDWLTDGRSRPAGTPVVLWVGRLLPRKAPMIAIQAFAKLRHLMPARLIIAGDGPLRSQVREAVERFGLSADVELPGQVSREEVRRLFDSASAFLFTSLRDSSGTPFLEALGRGLPAVALDHHGIGDVDTGAAALKVALPPRPHDLSGCLAGALETILRDGRWELRSAAGAKWAAQHTFPAKASAATRIYQEIAGDRSRAMLL